MEIELKSFTPAEQATFRLRALYEQAGYRKYRASRFEEYALYQEYQRFLPDSQVITFTDLDGKLRAIKPDVTLSIAKTAQPAAGECKRFYYNEEVCRPSRESHTFQTIHQMGLESMGAVDADEQAAVVRLALQSLAALEVPTVLEVSHMGFVTALLDTLRGLLQAAGWRGYANFDLKYDRRSEPVLFELNPRPGRASFYCDAAGAPLARPLVEDLLCCGPVTPPKLRPAVWHTAPWCVVRRHCPSRLLLHRAALLRRRGRASAHLLAAGEGAPRRIWFVMRQCGYARKLQGQRQRLEKG